MSSENQVKLCECGECNLPTSIPTKSTDRELPTMICREILTEEQLK